MTREENICQSCAHSKVCKFNEGESSEYCNQHLSLTALRPVSREQVEEVWRGEWIGDNGEKVGTIDGSPIKSTTCSVGRNWLVGSDEYDCYGHFCPACGRAMTDKAVEMVMERLEKMRNEL